MKTSLYIIMLAAIMFIPLTACEGEEVLRPKNVISTAEISRSKYGTSFSFTVTARDWRIVSGTEKYVEVPVSSLSKEIMRHGTVIFFMCEGGKHLSLPCTYYQVRRAVSFQPSYKDGTIFIYVLGNFTLNIHSPYTFSFIVVNAQGTPLLKDLSKEEYEPVRKVLGL